MLAGDLTGDGKDEIVMSRLAKVTQDERGSRRISAVNEVWSIGPDLQLEMLTEIDDRWLGDMADWDGDGDVELFVGHATLEGSTLDVWDVENGMWTDPEVAVAENHSPAQIGDFTGDGMLEVLWVPDRRAGEHADRGGLGRREFFRAVRYLNTMRGRRH